MKNSSDEQSLSIFRFSIIYMGKFQGNKNNKKCAFVKNKMMMISLLKKQKQKPQKGKFLQINNVIGTPLIFPRRKKQKGICMWGVTEFC